MMNGFITAPINYIALSKVEDTRSNKSTDNV